MATTTKPGLAQRFETYRPSKTGVAWTCAACVVATMVVGFVWGGWVTSSTANEMAAKAAAGANAKLAADVCAVQFNKDPEAATQLIALNKLDSWRRADFITQGGWAKISGMKDPITGAADLCAKQLSEPKL
jgi:type VI protein secretion system component VasK